MISEIYTPLFERKPINEYLGVLTKRSYTNYVLKLYKTSQKYGTALPDTEVNDYAEKYMRTKLRYGEVILNKEEQLEACKLANLDPYETDVWVNLSSGECLAGNCVIDDNHPDPMSKTMSEEFCKLHKSMSGLIIYRPYMILKDIRKFIKSEDITTATVELCVSMLMVHERRHRMQNADMISKCNTWMEKSITDSITEEERMYFDVAEEDANHARLDYGIKMIRDLESDGCTKEIGCPVPEYLA